MVMDAMSMKPIKVPKSCGRPKLSAIANENAVIFKMLQGMWIVAHRGYGKGCGLFADSAFHGLCKRDRNGGRRRCCTQCRNVCWHHRNQCTEGVFLGHKSRYKEYGDEHGDMQQNDEQDDFEEHAQDGAYMAVGTDMQKHTENVKWKQWDDDSRYD